MATEPEVSQNPGSKTALGPLAALESEGAYSFESLTYPIAGIGDEIPSYIVFYINLPEHPKYQSVPKSGVSSTSDQNIDLSRGGNYNAITDPGTAVATATLIQGSTQIVQAAQGGLGGLGERAGAVLSKQVLKGPMRAALGAVASDIKIKQKHNRLKTAIAIYMPDTIMHTYAHDYDAKSITEVLGTLGMAQRAGKDVGNALDEIGLTGGIEEAFNKAASSTGGAEVAANIIEQTTDLVGQGFSDLVVRGKGVAINPRIELLFRATQNRTFMYEFRFQSTSKKETENIQNIIKTFRKYAAPDTFDDLGSYFIPPGQFDIEYRFKNGVNQNIGRISTCVLENIAVNYSSAGQFATFSDGMPVEISLQLTFKEVDIITRDMIDKGGF